MALAHVGIIKANGNDRNTANWATWNNQTTTNAWAANDFVVAILATDNVTTTDTNSNDHTGFSIGSKSLTKALEFTNGQGSAAAGATVSVWYGVNDTGSSIASASTITVNLAGTAPGNGAKAFYIRAFSKVSTNDILLEATTAQSAEDSSTINNLTISGVTSREYLWVRGAAVESNDATDVTPTTNFTAYGRGLTTGGGSASNIGSIGEYRIATATSMSSDPTASFSSDLASVFVAFYEAAPVNVITKSGIGISAFQSQAADVFNPVETGSGLSPFASSGPKNITVSKTGLGASPFVADGSNANIFSETGTGITPFVSSGAKIREFAGRTGSGITAFTGSGADVETKTETGSGISAFTVLGADTITSAETGTGISTFTGSGADVKTSAETGAGIVVFTASGVQVFIGGSGTTYTKSGIAIAALLASGPDVTTRSETGAGISPFIGSGASLKIPGAIIKTGSGMSVFTATGADIFAVSETGSGILVMTSSGFSSDLVEIPCLYLPLTAEIDPHITTVEQSLISYMVTVDDVNYIVAVEDSYVLVATVEEDVTTATINDVKTLTEIEMTSQ